jgi:hypothetical protein
MVFLSLNSNIASLAQLVEQLIRNEQVGGSSPPKGSHRKCLAIIKIARHFF